MKTNKTIIGVLGAAAIGAVVGVLFAPDKGTNTRKKIAKKTSEKKDEVKAKLDQLKDTISEKYSSVLHKGEQLIENGQAEIDNIKTINKEKVL